jgi:hypothetical protein
VSGSVSMSLMMTQSLYNKSRKKRKTLPLRKIHLQHCFRVNSTLNWLISFYSLSALTALALFKRIPFIKISIRLITKIRILLN